MKVRSLIACLLLCALSSLAWADLSEGLVAYYPFNGNADDASGNNRDGVIHGATSAPDQDGVAHSAYEFDGIDDYMSFPKALPDMTEMTFWTWLYIPSGQTGLFNIFVDADGEGLAGIKFTYSSDFGVYLESWKSGHRLKVYPNVGQQVTDRWVNIAWVMTGAYSLVYVDGEEAVRVDIGGSNVGGHKMFLAHQHVGGRPFANAMKGRIASARFYDRALKPTDILALYEAGGDGEVETSSHDAMNLYVDDDALLDPWPNDSALSDPDEDGTQAHPYDAIQEAIDAAQSGDTIVVRGGTYYETIDFLGKSLHVTGYDPNAAIQPDQPCPIIDAAYQGTAVTFSSGEDANAILSGFTITRGLGQYGGGLLCLGSHPSISNCLIVGNRTTESWGGGAVYAHNSRASFEHCTMSGNYGGPAGAGFYSDQSNNTITNSILWGNLPAELWYPMFDDASNPPVFMYCDLPLETLWAGNIIEHPGFVAPGYWSNAAWPGVPANASDTNVIWMDGDYHLTPNSPCVDAGDPDTVIDANQLDLDGQLRLTNDRIDMGSDEYMRAGQSYVAVYNEISVPLIQDIDASEPDTSYIGKVTLQLDAPIQRLVLGYASPVSLARGQWLVFVSKEVIGPGMGIDVELTILGTNVHVSRLADVPEAHVLAEIELASVLNMEFVTIDDPGSPERGGFKGEMSKYETTNAQYCQYLNSAFEEGLIVEYYGKIYDATDARHIKPFFETASSIPTSQIAFSEGTFSVLTRDKRNMVNHPVVEVSWFGANAFCEYYGYRLPTQWEWQAVADYDGSYIYGCGTTIDQSKANYAMVGDIRANPNDLSDYPYTSRAGYYPSFGYGLCDMAGNVWEWTSSTAGDYRILCGGGWTENGPKCMVSKRGSFSLFQGFYSIGFRVCR